MSDDGIAIPSSQGISSHAEYWHAQFSEVIAFRVLLPRSETPWLELVLKE